MILTNLLPISYQWKTGTWRRCIRHTFPLQSAFLKVPLEVRPLSSPTRALVSDVSLAFSLIECRFRWSPIGIFISFMNFSSFAFFSEISGPELHTIGNAFQKSKIEQNVTQEKEEQIRLKRQNNSNFRFKKDVSNTLNKCHVFSELCLFLFFYSWFLLSVFLFVSE